MPETYLELYREAAGWVPKFPIDAAKKCVQRAWRDLRKRNIWSFLLSESTWSTPSIVNAGSVTTTQGSNQVVFDSTAAAAINAIGLQPWPITQYQFRVGIGTIYSIWGWDEANTATLNRPYAEQSGSNVSFGLFKCYYPAPSSDFGGWVSCVDKINFNPLIVSGVKSTREWLDHADPQRTIFYLPTNVVSYLNDMNPASPFYNYMQFELWGLPQYELSYDLYYYRNGTDFVNDTDTLPFVIGSDVVMARAKWYAYEWAEANKGDIPRGNGSDYKYLMGKADKEYDSLYRLYRKTDRAIADSWLSVRMPQGLFAGLTTFYNSISQSANPGMPY